MSNLAEPMVVSIALSAGENTPDEETDRLSRQLMREIRESGMDAEPVRLAGVTPGAKAGEMLEAGSLLLTMMPVVAPKLIDILNGWLGRGANRHIRMKMADGAEFELTGDMPMADIQALLAKMTPVVAASPTPAVAGA